LGISVAVISNAVCTLYSVLFVIGHRPGESLLELANQQQQQQQLPGVPFQKAKLDEEVLVMIIIVAEFLWCQYVC